MDALEQHRSDAPDQRLPFPSPRNDVERTENILWLIENEPQQWRDLVPFEASDMGPADNANSSERSPSNLFGLIGTAHANRNLRAFRNSLTLPELGRFDFYNHWYRRLMQVESRNPYLITITPPNYVPSVQNVKDIAQEALAAEARFYLGLSPRPSAFLGALPPLGGNNEYTIVGRLGHRFVGGQLEPLGYQLNVPLAGRSMFADAVRRNPRDTDLVEIKANTPTAIGQGSQQLPLYTRALRREHKQPVNSRIETYNPQEIFQYIFGL